MPDNKQSRALRYRFSGWHLPLHMWDETGHAWAILPPHPYLRNQPLIWQDAWSFGQPSFYFVGSGTSAGNSSESGSGGESDCQQSGPGAILPPRLQF